MHACTTEKDKAAGGMGVRWTDAFGNGAVHEDVCMEMKPKTKQKTKKTARSYALLEG